MLHAEPYMRPRFSVKHLRPSAPMTSDVVVPEPETAAGDFHADAHSTAGFKALLLGSIGVVYGDIGTSALDAFREAVMAAGGSPSAVTPEAGLDLLPLVVWVL